MIEHLTLGAFTVALLMSLAALCAFVWGASTGAFRGLERIKHQVLRAEGADGGGVDGGGVDDDRTDA
jgi:cbb3-type cytochrome oxidase maturation protein